MIQIRASALYGLITLSLKIAFARSFALRTSSSLVAKDFDLCATCLRYSNRKNGIETKIAPAKPSRSLMIYKEKTNPSSNNMVSLNEHQSSCYR